MVVNVVSNYGQLRYARRVRLHPTYLVHLLRWEKRLFKLGDDDPAWAVRGV